MQHRATTQHHLTPRSKGIASGGKIRDCLQNCARPSPALQRPGPRDDGAGAELSTSSHRHFLDLRGNRYSSGIQKAVILATWMHAMAAVCCGSPAANLLDSASQDLIARHLPIAIAPPGTPHQYYYFFSCFSPWHWERATGCLSQRARTTSRSLPPPRAGATPAPQQKSTHHKV